MMMNKLKSNLCFIFSINNLMILITIFIGIMGIVSEDTLYQNGFEGWDASYYSTLARDFFGTLTGKYQEQAIVVGAYNLQRILPSAIVAMALNLFKISPTTQNVIYAFGIYNAILLIFISVFWNLISNYFKLNNPQKCLGYIFLFFNFSVLKHRSYDPVLTDTTAYALGTALLYFYLKAENKIVLLLSALGMFSWPTIVYQGLIMLFFPKTDSSLSCDNEFNFDDHDSKFFNSIITNVFSYIVPLIISFFSFLLIKNLIINAFTTALPAYLPAVNLSTSISIFYIFVCFYFLFRKINFLTLRLILKAFKNFNYSKIYFLILFASIILFKFFRDYLSMEGAFEYPIENFIKVTFWTSILYPASFYVSHIMYFGLVFVFLLFVANDFFEMLLNQGLGMTLCTTMLIFLSLNSESRQIINFYPIIVTFIVKSLGKIDLNYNDCLLIAMINLLFSKVWLTIGPMNLEGVNKNVLLDNQLLFMNNGPAMSSTSYVIHLASSLFSVVFVCYFLLMKKGIWKKGY